jgi:hypothetical protein
MQAYAQADEWQMDLHLGTFVRRVLAVFSACYLSIFWPSHCGSESFTKINYSGRVIKGEKSTIWTCILFACAISSQLAGSKIYVIWAS